MTLIDRHGRTIKGQAWRRCCYCGRFISDKDMGSKRTGCDFTPDTQFTSESVDWYHVACKGKP